MEEIKTTIDDLILIKPSVYMDERGEFLESYNDKKYPPLIKEFQFSQDNLSKSHKHVLRGLHFQLPPYAQGKLVQVLRGCVLDVAVDLRKSSSTFGKYFSVELNEDNKLQLWIPAGFAHGFIAKEANTIFSYKCSNSYSPTHERTLLWNDSELNIDWGFESPIVSSKDRDGILFKNFKSPF
jgi:dTDP-4-dehydrorhamnose 3,5-epimerase